MTESNKTIQITHENKFNWASCSKCCYPVLLNEIGTENLEDEFGVNGHGKCNLCRELNEKRLLTVNVKP